MDGPVYSYIRFSTPEQRKGTGQVRQEDAASAWCRKRNKTLVKSYSDLGVSAYKGRNATHGDLARFLALVKDRRIPPNATLLVENLDRLSRNNINKAVELLLGIINSGVTVVTLCDEMEYSSSKCDMAQLMMSVVYFARGNEESKMKSIRKAGSWRVKRERALKEGCPLDGKTPSWIRVEDGKYRVVEEEARKVRQIFQDYVHGMGIYTLSGKHDIPRGTLGYWLSSPMVIGTVRMTEEGKPVDIPNHYPAIIDRQTWETSQRLRGERYIQRRGGRTGYVNLFAGLLVDPQGRRMDIARHNGGRFASYVSLGGPVVQVRPLECVVCYEKLKDRFAITRYVEDDGEEHPRLKVVKEKIAAVQKEMGSADDIALLMPVLRELRAEQRELEKSRRKVVKEEVDDSLIASLLTEIDNREARLQLRELVRENVKKIRLTKVENTNWFFLVQGAIELVDGGEEQFSYAYCSRRIGYYVTDRMTDEVRRTLLDRHPDHSGRLKSHPRSKFPLGAIRVSPPAV